MEITKVNIPVKVLSKRCAKCPQLEIVCNEVLYGKEIKQYVYECKNLHHCIFMAELLKDEQKQTK